MSSVVTRCYGVKHYVRIITIRCYFGTQLTIGARDFTSKITHDGTGNGRGDQLFSLCDPICSNEVYVIAQWFILFFRWFWSILEFKNVRGSSLEPNALEFFLSSRVGWKDNETIMGWIILPHDAARGYSSEIGQHFILESKHVPFNSDSFPSSLSPVWESTARCFYHWWPGKWRWFCSVSWNKEWEKTLLIFCLLLFTALYNQTHKAKSALPFKNWPVMSWSSLQETQHEIQVDSISSLK